MAIGAYFGTEGKARKVKKIYVGVGGVARKVWKGYIGVGDKARLFWNFSPEIEVSTLPSADSLSMASASTSYLNRCTVFNDRAIFCDRAPTATKTYIATYTPSLTKSEIVFSHSSGASCYMTQCAKLPSYAILGGCSKNCLGYPFYNSERKIKLNSSFTASNLETNGDSGMGGAGTQTTSYALFIGTQSHEWEEIHYEAEIWKSEGKISAFNNNLSKTIIDASWIGTPISAASFGDVAVFSGGSIDNSLTVTKRTSITTPNSVLQLANSSEKIVFNNVDFIDGGTSATRYYLLTYKILNKSFTITTTSASFSSGGSRNRWNFQAAGSTPDLAIFAGGGSASTYEDARSIIHTIDPHGTVRYDKVLPSKRVGLQSSVLPVGATAMFAGGSNPYPAWIVNNDDNYTSNYVYAVTEK